MNEKELLQKIKADAGQIAPPDSLSPDAIEKLLGGIQMRADDSDSSPDAEDLSSQMQKTAEPQAFEDSDVSLKPAFQTNHSFQAQTSKDFFSSQPQKPGNFDSTQSSVTERSAAMRNSNKKPHRFLLRFGAAAAVFILAFLVVGLAGRISNNNDSSESSNVQTESDGILTASLTDASDKSAANNGNDPGSTKTEVETANDPAADLNADSAEAVTEIVNADKTSAVASVSADTTDPFTYAFNYEEIYEAISVLYSEEGTTLIAGYGADSNSSSSSDGASSDTSSLTARSSVSNSTSDTAEEVMAVEESIEEIDTAAADDEDYSTTNIQEIGVDEADIVKTDGTYIYILRTSGEFLIVRAGDDLELISQTAIESENNLTALELYLDGDTLSVITSEYGTSLESIEDGVYYTYSSRITALYTWDITDRSEPTLTGCVTQEGYYSDSRKVGDYIYLFSSWYPTIGASYAESTITPLLNGKAAASPPTCIFTEKISCSESATKRMNPPEPPQG